MSEVLLIFPPSWDIYSPYTSLPTLAAFLKAKGIRVETCDVNIELYDHLISDRFLEENLGKAENELLSLATGSPEFLDRTRKIELGKMMLGKIDDAKQHLRSFSCGRETMIWAKNIIENTRVVLSLSGQKKYPKRLTDLFQEVQSASDHLWYTHLRAYVGKKLDAFSGNVVGISVAGSNQLSGAFLTARMIKEKNPALKIVMGGPFFQYWPSVLHGRKNFPEMDFLVVGEGETPLYRLLEEVHGSGHYENVPNLFYAGEDGKYQASGKQTMEDLNALPVPDYGTMPLSRYFCPEIISYITARGCYWNHCRFCSLACNYGHQYHVRDLERVVDDLLCLKEKHRLKYLFFNDEALSPSRLFSLSEKMIANGLDLKCFANARLEDSFSRKHFEKAYEAGFRILFFGMESGSQETLQRMKKGTQPESMARVFRESHESGLANHISVLTDFPGDREIEKTITFVKENGAYIDSMVCGFFCLENTSYVFQHPDEFSISIGNVPEDYFGPDYPYREAHGKKSSDHTDFLLFLQSFMDYPFHPTKFYGYDERHFLIHVSQDGRDILRLRNEKSIEKELVLRQLWQGPVDFFIRTRPEVEFKEIPAGVTMAFNPLTGHVVFSEVTCAFLGEARSGVPFSHLLARLGKIFEVDEQVLKTDLGRVMPLLSIDFVEISPIAP